MRIAAIDIGTNTVLMLVAERRGADVVAVEDHHEITRLGEGVDRTRALAPAAIERTCACLDRYAEIAKRLGVERAVVVGTSAMRDAKGGEAVRDHVRAKFGVDARVISGEEEARVTFVGALSGLGVRGPVRVFDIGGGSTEIVAGAVGVESARVASAESFDVGSVRLTERHVRSDPPTAEELAAVRADVDRALAGVAPLAQGETLVGIAGTVTTLAAVALGLKSYDGARVHGHLLDRPVLAAVASRLAALPLEARRGVPGVHPKRADVIVAGAVIALAVVERTRAESLVVSDRGVRWGLAVAALEDSAKM